MVLYIGIFLIALLQAPKSSPRTFSELASFELHLVKSTSSQYKTRTDLYPTIYIKSPERTNRSARGAIQIKFQGGSLKYPTQWKKYLCDGRNKKGQAALLVQEWQQPHCRAQFTGIGELYVTHGAECQSWLLGRMASPAVGWMNYAYSKRKRTLTSYCMPAVMHHLVDMTATSSSHQTQMLARTFSHRINVRMLYCTSTKP